MRAGINPNSATRSPRARVLATATLVCTVLVAGCGGSSDSPTTTTTASAGTPVSSKTSTVAAAPAAGNPGVAFAACMRSNGVPDFPDPSAGRGLIFKPGAGVNPVSPAFRAAQAKCKSLLPNGGPPGPGSTTHPSAQTLAKLVRIAQCMRDHGVSQFPDPRTSVPSNLDAYTEITDFDSAILLFPRTLNLHAPAYKQALAECGAPPLGLPH